MKNNSKLDGRVSLAAAALMLATAVNAQVDEPLESPLAKVSQVVGTEPISITYYSPGVKDRAIWGELVPYGQNWRAGANGKTIFEFAEPVTIDGKRIEAGAYGFYIFPQSADSWELVWNSNTEGSANEFQAAEDVLRVEVTPVAAPFRERLQYAIENFSDWPPFTADLVMHWEKLKVSVRLQIEKKKP